MGYCHQIFLVIILFISLQCCRRSMSFSGFVVVVEAQELEDWNVFTEANGKRDQTQIGKVSGEDENEKTERRILEKFRYFFGFSKPSTPRNPGKSDSFPSWLSPAPSPSPYGGPSKSPVHSPAHLRRTPPRFHRPLPQGSHPPRQHEIQGQKQEGNAKKILVPVVVATASGVGFVFCVVGLFCLCGKIKKQRKIKNSRKFSFNQKKKCRSQNSATRKVSINPTLEFLYLNSSGLDLEQQSSVCVREAQETHNISCNYYNNGELLEDEAKKPETEILHKSDIVISSSTREIVSVHNDNDEQAYSSDDEAFHSVGGSQSSHTRLSNASSGSVGESSERFRQYNLAEIPESSRKYTGISSESTPPPPPPPPPPPMFLTRRICPRYSLGTASEASSSCKTGTNLENISPVEAKEASKSSSGAYPVPPSFPPPPPPPLPLAGGNKTPPPPPMSRNFSQDTLLRKDGAPLPKLKPLHWDKVRATPDRSMVWDKMRTSSFELDEEMIESLFGYTMQSCMNNDETKSKTPSPGKHLLEPKRLQNITILMKALNATTEQVCDALTKGEGLRLRQLEALVKMVPTKEEESKFCSYKGAIDELGSAEKFIRELLRIPFAFLRAEGMLYKETFEDEVVHLRNSFSMLEEACKELKSSRLFLKLLETVLKTGNRMNVGTIRGGAKAFKLDALLKLSDVKGTDGKTTLLHFVVQEISRSEGIRISDSIMGRIMNQKRSRTRSDEEKEEDYRRMGLELVSGLNTELCNVKKTATVDLDVLASSVTNLKEGKVKLKRLVKENLSEDEKDITFVSCMELFLKYAEGNLEKLEEDENNVMAKVREITEYFHGDVSREEKNPLRIFVIVRDFLGMLDSVCKELRSQKVQSIPNPLAPFR